MKIMLVEDDEALAGEIGSFLRRWGYETVEARHFDRIGEEFSQQMPQLVLMDINLPFYDGFYWCGKIRQVSDVPILYISSRSDDQDKIMAMAQGGDDYVEKPFRLELLKAKIQAILRRAYEYKVRERIFLGEGLYFSLEQQALYFHGKEIELTKLERQVFQRLAAIRPDVAAREELMMELWNTEEYVSDGTLTTVVCRLRGKLKAACGREVIQTKKGQGYWIP
ncbi:DNA-binding response regulator [bacterium D16-54]|nr:DNA-binding response regulator [bacterium D16-54]RKJ14419.1 DNA-binding response regulator [bacterium D16-56]